MLRFLVQGMEKKSYLYFNLYFISISIIFTFWVILKAKILFAVSDDYKDDYKIGAEDLLYISVWGNEQLRMKVIVRPDGKISFPLINDLQVSGLTCREVKETITERLASYVSKPEVIVIVETINNYKVYILGSVDSPGVLNLKRKTTLLQALAMLGGLALSDRVDLKKAYLLRGTNQLPVDFEKLILEGDISQDTALLPDDIIYLPDNFENRLTIIGEVVKPGTITFRKDITVLDAVLMSGGATEHADLNDTKVIRKKGDRRKEVVRVRLHEIMKKGKLEDNIKLQPRDTVFIPASIF